MMKKLNSLILVLIWGLCSSSIIFAEEDNAGTIERVAVIVEAKTDKTEVFIGDKIKYSVIVKAPADLELELPMFGENLGGFAVNDFNKTDKIRFGKRTIYQWFDLDTYVTGSYEIPPVVIRYKDVNTDLWEEVESAVITVEVKSVLNEAGADLDVRDIKGPERIGRNWVWLIVLGCLILVAGFAYLIKWFVEKKKHGFFAPPPRPAHEVAYEALQILLNKNLISEHKIKEFYSELSLIVRHYLENRFTLRAPEMTTEEFLVSVKDSSELKVEHKHLLRDFMVQCDMVKFAKYAPGKDEIDLSYEAAVKLVDQTKEELLARDDDGM